MMFFLKLNDGEILIERFQVKVVGSSFLYIFCIINLNMTRYLYFTGFKYFVLIWYRLLSMKYIIFLYFIKELGNLSRVVTRGEFPSKRSILNNTIMKYHICSYDRCAIISRLIWLRSAIIDSHQDNENPEIWRVTIYIKDRKSQCIISTSS